MSITKVQNVPLVAQISDGVCWCASALMLYRWAQATGNSGMKDPLSDSGTKSRWENNKDWDPSDNGFLASTLNMQIQSSIPTDYTFLNTFLQLHGPIWAAGQKNWGGANHGHVVVICGVADTGVFIYDPEPVNQGSSQWLTWDQLRNFSAGTTADVKYLTAA